jgi:hypothetical protein
MKYFIIEDPLYVPSHEDKHKKEGVLIDADSNLWLVPQTEIKEEDPRIVTDELKIKKADCPGTIYDKKRVLPSIGSGHSELQLTKDGICFLDGTVPENSLSESFSEELAEESSNPITLKEKS